MSRKNITDIQPGETVDETFLVTEKNITFSQKGNPYISLRLRDKTGEMEGRIWDNAIEAAKLFQKGDVVSIKSRAVSYKNMTQLSILKIGVTDEADPVDYLEESPVNMEEAIENLMDFVESIENIHLKTLLKLIFDDEKILNSFKKAPAAKGFHHFYIGGLIEHTLSVVRLLDLVSNHYKQINRDLAITGGILHDIGKIYELSFVKTIDYTTEGRLIGHIVLGLEFVDGKIAMIDDFPRQLALELRHILLSHHGVLEYGSPKRPKTVEALAVNMIDDLDAKINAFQTFIEGSDSNDDSPDWTPFHRLLERFIYKGK